MGDRVEVRICVDDGPDRGLVVMKTAATAKMPAPWYATNGEALTEREVSSWPRIASGVIHDGRWLQDQNRLPSEVEQRAWEAFNAYRMRPAFLRAMRVIQTWLASNTPPASEESR